MAYEITFPDQHLELDGVPLSTPAWEVLNLHVLLAGPPTRGTNVVIPGASGVKARRRRATERRVTLELHINGSTDPEGNPHADPALGLLENIEELRLTTDPTAVDDSVIPATLHWKGEERTGGVQVEGLEIGEHVGTYTVAATIDLTIIAGVLA